MQRDFANNATRNLNLIKFEITLFEKINDFWW